MGSVFIKQPRERESKLRDKILEAIVEGKFGHGLVVTNKELNEKIKMFEEKDEDPYWTFYPDSFFSQQKKAHPGVYFLNKDEGEHYVNPNALIPIMKEKGLI
jgi:hypothetical protein